MKKLLSITSLALFSQALCAASFTAKPGGGDWNLSSTWTFSGGADADGIPDSDDIVSIGSGITVTVSVDNQQSAALTIANGGTLTFNNVDKFTSNGFVTVNGTMNGTFSGSSSSFIKANNSNGFGGAGTINITGNLRFNCNAYIQAGVTVNNTGNIIIGDNAGAGFFMGNYGNVTLNNGTVDGTVNSSQLVTLSNSILTVNAALFPTAGFATTTASYCSNNTIIFDGASAYSTKIINFENITIRGAGTKTLSSAGTTSILKTLTIDNGATLQQSTQLVSFGASSAIVNNGDFFGDNGTISFKGTSINNTGNFLHPNKFILAGTTQQTITSTSGVFSFYNLYSQNPAGVVKSGDITVGGLLYIPSGNFNNFSGNLRLSGSLSLAGSGTFTANNNSNTVTVAYPTGNIPVTTSGYYNLVIGASAGTKTLPSNTIVLNNLTIDANNTLSANNFDLSVAGGLTNNGTFTGSAGKNLNLNGSLAQTVAGTGTSNYQGLTINNAAGVSISSGTHKLNEVLTISNGNFNTNGNSFTMNSTASKTARIAQVSATGSISGNFTVQRFITARDTTWSIMSSPVQSTTIADWDNELFINYSTDPNIATVQSYDESIADYTPVSSSGTTVSPMQGFEVYLTASTSLTNISNITLNTIGVPNFGDQSLPLSYTDGTGYEGQNLVGNPFASSIAWSTVYSASINIENYADVFDYTTGNYANVNLGSEIGLGQGFWVYALGTGATLNIPESAKTTSSNSSLRGNYSPLFNLTISSANGDHEFAHKLELTSNNAFDNSKDENDRLYRTSPNKKAPKITALVDGKDYVRNAFNSDNNNYDLPLTVQVGIDGKYAINASNIDMVSNDYPCVTLEDKKLNQVIDLNSTSTYAFFASANDSKDRFQLHFSKNGNCRTMSSSIASAIENQVQVLPTVNGNSITFNFTETLNTTVTVTNLLGQTIVEGFAIQANTQTIELGIPSDFSGMYIIKIENEKGVVTKKFVKK